VTGDRLSLSGPGIELIFEPVLPVPTADLVDTTWMLESLVQDDAVSSVSGDPATLILASDGTFVASTGCRTLSGRWIEGDGVIVVPEMAADGDCRADLAAQDSQVVSVVGDEFRFAVDGDTLTLTSMGGEGLIYRVDASMEDAGSPVGRWQLVEGVDIVDGFPIGLVVDSEQLSGRSGCNSYSAPVSLGEGSISPGEFTSTMMACGSPVDEVEISYQTSLMVVTRYRVAGGRLTLTGPDVELVFEPATPSATADVVDRFWVLESLGGGDVASGDSATLTLDSDGTLSGGIGCRTFTGRWAEQDGMVVVADFETEGECRGELVDQDAYVVSVLDGTVYTDVDGYTLTVTSAGGEVLVYGS